MGHFLSTMQRRFLVLVAVVVGVPCFGTIPSTSGQAPFDRAGADEALKGHLFFWAK
jgi:hypothetical protein